MTPSDAPVKGFQLKDISPRAWQHPADRAATAALGSVPYLDKVVREILRLHPPVTLVNREAQHDDVIPVSEPFVDARGKLQHGVEVRRGNRIFVGIAAFQTSREVWGADALEFKCVDFHPINSGSEFAF